MDDSPDRSVSNAFLRNPQESQDTEIKSWLDPTDDKDGANLARELLALQNHGGGRILIGYLEDNGIEPQPDPANYLEAYTYDTISSLIERYADPKFECSVQKIDHPETGQVHPVIFVPGDSDVPVRAERGSASDKISVDAYYIRRPGAKSSPPQSSREWDQLIRRCVRRQREHLVDAVRHVITGFTEDGAQQPTKDLVTDDNSVDGEDSFTDWISDCFEQWRADVSKKFGDVNSSPYRHGYWIFAYKIEDGLSVDTLSELKSALRSPRKRSGWPVWLMSNHLTSPGPASGTELRGWALTEDNEPIQAADYWRADLAGRLFQLRRYQEDYRDEFEPGRWLNGRFPVFRLTQCLLHAKEFANTYGLSEVIHTKVEWHGIAERQLKFEPHRGGPTQRYGGYESVNNQATLTVTDLESNLVEAVKHLVRPLHESFDLFEMSESVISESVNEVKSW